jgi:anti-sigma factor RsiW
MSHLSDETLQAFADEALEGPLRAQAAEHLESCAQCKAHLSDYRALFAGLEKLPAPPPPPHFTDSVMARIAAQNAALVGQRRLALATFAAATLVALGCFALAGKGAMAHQFVAAGSGALDFVWVGRALIEAIAPVLAAFRLELAALAAAVCIPTLLALHRSFGPRTQAA